MVCVWWDGVEGMLPVNISGCGMLTCIFLFLCFRRSGHDEGGTEHPDRVWNRDTLASIGIALRALAGFPGKDLLL